MRRLSLNIQQRITAKACRCLISICTEQARSVMISRMTQSETLQSPQVLLIDLDNCPAVAVASLPNNLEQFDRIVGCSGPQEPRIPLSLATALATPLHKGTLELVKMKRGGKNAADFGLAFLAGRLLAEMPEETEFLIHSRDKDLDHVIDLLHGYGRKARRTAPDAPQDLKPSPQLTESGLSIDINELASAYWLSRLSDKQSNRPASEKTLLKSVRDFEVGTGVDKAKAVIGKLQDWNILHIAASGKRKVTYTGRTPPVLAGDEPEEELGEEEDDIPF